MTTHDKDKDLGVDSSNSSPSPEEKDGTDRSATLDDIARTATQKALALMGEGHETHDAKELVQLGNDLRTFYTLTRVCQRYSRVGGEMYIGNDTTINVGGMVVPGAERCSVPDCGVLCGAGDRSVVIFKEGKNSMSTTNCTTQLEGHTLTHGIVPQELEIEYPVNKVVDGETVQVGTRRVLDDVFKFRDDVVTLIGDIFTSTDALKSTTLSLLETILRDDDASDEVIEKRLADAAESIDMYLEDLEQDK